MGGEEHQLRQIDPRSLSIIVFATFFAWLLAFPFEGQVLYAIAGQSGVDPRSLIFRSIAAHLCGLCCGLFVKTMQTAKQLILYSIVICIASSVCFFFAPSWLWNLLLVASLLSGACVAAWGFYFRAYTPSEQRLGTAAEGLIYSNALMIAVNMMAVYLAPQAGLATAMILLASAFVFALRLPDGVSAVGMASMGAQTATALTAEAGPTPGQRLGKPLGLLCLFIVVITINSGLMYQVINPDFAHLQWLVSWYWAIPYIAALQVMKRLPKKSNRAHILYVAMAMIGFAFIFFMILDRSAVSYLLINTLMLGACGIFDLFWWSILGGMLDLGDNPARILGIGLAANVAGVLLGGMLGSRLTASGSGLVDPTVLALGVVLVALVILPLLHQQLMLSLRNHAFIMAFSAVPEPAPVRAEPSASPPPAVPEAPVMEQPPTINRSFLANTLTERERQIADLLSRGRTYKMIAGELFLSENTVKTHIKSIYSKLGVQSKAELIGLLIKQDRSLTR
ncbi:MAG: response regulator transcription factor [Bacillota bacterium]